MRDKWVLFAEDVPKNYVTFDLSPGLLLYSLLGFFLFCVYLYRTIKNLYLNIKGMD